MRISLECKSASIVLVFLSVAHSREIIGSSLRGSDIDSSIIPSKKLIRMPLIPHHIRIKETDYIDNRNNNRSRNRRRLDRPGMNWTKSESAAGDADPFAYSIDALYQGYGTHYVDLWVGTPPQRQTVIVDTGSSVTAFPCQDCTNCGVGYHIDQYFQEDLSVTFREVSCESCVLSSCGGGGGLCELSVSYQEGSSWRAFEAADSVYTGGPHDIALEDTDESFEMHFGCQTHLTGLFKTQLADGIMGMEMSPTSYWNQMYDAGITESKQFSMCFSRSPLATKEGTLAGAMTMGGTDARLHDTKMVYAAQNNVKGWYTVKIKNVFLRVGGGESVESTESDAKTMRVNVSPELLNDGDIIVDSGTTDTYLTARLAVPFDEQWSKIVGTRFHNNPQSLTEDELLALPTILFQLEAKYNEDPTAQGLAGELDPKNPQDIMIAMPPTHYMEYSNKDEQYTARLYFDEGHGGVLGANFMMGHEVYFDVEGERLGFSESSCDYSTVASAETSER
jgi:Xylanase inhibitor N-terminal